MARDLDGTDDKLTRDSAVVSVYPVTMFIRFNADNAVDSDYLIGIYEDTTFGETGMCIQARGDVAGDPVEARV